MLLALLRCSATPDPLGHNGILTIHATTPLVWLVAALFGEVVADPVYQPARSLGGLLPHGPQRGNNRSTDVLGGVVQVLTKEVGPMEMELAKGVCDGLVPLAHLRCWWRR